MSVINRDSGPELPPSSVARFLGNDTSRVVAKDALLELEADSQRGQ